MSTRLTDAQGRLWDSLCVEAGVWAECDQSEWRTAKALEAKGLIEIDPRVRDSQSAPRRFDARSLPARNYNHEPRKLPYGAHQFVMARPLVRDWSEFDGSTMKQGREDFRPVMIRGHQSGQGVYVAGSAYSYKLTDFEIGADVTEPFGGVGEPC